MIRRCRLGLAVLLTVFSLACSQSPDAQLEEIHSLQRAGRYAATIEPLREMLVARPDDPELNHLYGIALLSTDQAGLALWPLRKAAEHPDRAVVDGALLAGALLRGGSNPNDAILAATRVLELDPERIDVLRILIEARVAASDSEQVLIDVERLLELKPDDVGALIWRLVALLKLNRVDEAERALTAVNEAVEDIGDFTGEDSYWLPRVCAATATFAKEKGDPATAETLWVDCLERFPAEEIVVTGASDFYEERRQIPRIIEILRRALEVDPANGGFIEALAFRLEDAGESEEAERILIAATQDDVNKQHPWFMLADYYEERNEPAKARDAMEHGLAIAGDSAPAMVRAQYVDLLIRAGDYDLAAEAIAEFATDSVLASLLRGRLLLARGEPAEALEAIDEGLRLWPGNSVARWLAAQAAEQLGDYDRALAEYVEALRADHGNTEALFALLRLADALGRSGEMTQILDRYLEKRPRDPEALAVKIRIASLAGQPEVSQRAFRALREIPGERGRAVATVAEAEAIRSGYGAGIAVIRSARLNLTLPNNGPALRALTRFLVATERYADALKRVDAAIAAHPGEAQFHELRGIVSMAAGDRDTAGIEFERALALEAERASALTELAALSAAGGNPQAAIALYDRADAADPEDPEHAWNAIQLITVSGNDAETERRLEALLSRHGYHAAAANLLAQRLLTRDPERAHDLASRSVRFQGGPNALDTLGRIELQRGDPRLAAQTLTRSIELRPESPSTHYWLGLALSANGDLDGARNALRTALETDVFPEREDASAELARLSAE